MSNKYTELSFPNYKRVVSCHNFSLGLKAFIAIHNTNLGPALGGCRMWNYTNENEAILDALRLSEGMTYKNAIAGLPYGGGKGVIWADPSTQKTESILKAFAEFINYMKGEYISAEDVGITPKDTTIINEVTSFVAAGDNGDPSPATAKGIFEGIKATIKHKYGSNNLKDKRALVVGLGSVGSEVCKLLNKSKAKLSISDININLIETYRRKYKAIVETSNIQKMNKVDIFVPCAMGGFITTEIIKYLPANIIAGSANNQLLSSEVGESLFKNKILYAPDYVINAGGVIKVGLALQEKLDKKELNKQLRNIGKTLTKIYVRSEEEQKPTNIIADDMAREIFMK